MPKTVIITGASQGIGKSTALKFAQEGYDIVLAARQPERLEAVADEVRSLGREALAVPTDVRDVEQVKVLVERAIAHFRRIDVLINNAGVYFLGNTEAASMEDWRTIIDTNLWGYINTIHTLLPHFLEYKTGTIVNVSSIGGITPLPYQVPYTTSKYAVTGLTRSLHAELAPKGVRVCGIYPSFIRSDLMERAIFRGSEEKTATARAELMERAIQVPLLEKPADVANAIWQAVKHQKADVEVGTAKLWNAAFHLFPSGMQTLLRQTFGMSERTAD